jgi:hypothetical protein
MFAIFYLLFVGCLGFLLFCADLIRWPISRFRLPRAQQLLNIRIPETLASSAHMQALASIPGQVG